MRVGKHKLVVVGLFLLACFVWLLMLVLWYRPAGECSSPGESHPANESETEELPPPAEQFAPLQQQLLDFAWSDPMLMLDDTDIDVPFEKLLEYLLAGPAKINPYDKENLCPFISEI